MYKRTLHPFCRVAKEGVPIMHHMPNFFLPSHASQEKKLAVTHHVNEVCNRPLLSYKHSRFQKAKHKTFLEKKRLFA